MRSNALLLVILKALSWSYNFKEVITDKKDASYMVNVTYCSFLNFSSKQLLLVV